MEKKQKKSYSQKKKKENISNINKMGLQLKHCK